MARPFRIASLAAMVAATGWIAMAAVAQQPLQPNMIIPIPSNATATEAAAARAMNNAVTNDDATTAIHMLIAATAENPDSPFANFAEAVGYYRGSRYEYARVLADEAISHEPNKAAYYYVRGLATRYDPDIWNLSELRKAGDDFKQAYTLDPKFESAYRERGAATLYLSRLAPNTDGDYDGSDVTDLRMALQEDPNDPEAHFAYGMAEIAGGDYQGAHDDLVKTVALGVVRSEVFENLAFAEFKLGQKDQAAADYQKAISADAGNITATANLAALGTGGTVAWVPQTLDPWVTEIRALEYKYYEQVAGANANADGDTGETNECIRDGNWWADIDNGNDYLMQMIALMRSDADKRSYGKSLTESQATEAKALQQWHDAGCG